MNDTGSKKESSAEGEVNVTPATEKKEKEERRRNEEGEEEEEEPDANEYDGGDGSGGRGGEEEEKEKMEEEEEEEKKMKEEKKSEKSTMELLFDYVKEEEKKGDKSEFRFVVKKRNLENNPPKRNEKLRAGLEKKTLSNLLLAIKGKLETLVVKYDAVYTVNVDYNGEKETFELSLPAFVNEFLQKVNDYDAHALMSVLLVEQSECFLKILIERQPRASVECPIDAIDDSFGSPDMMNLLLTMMQELVVKEEAREETDVVKISDVVKFSDKNTKDLMKAFEFMKMFEKTDDANVSKYCCILMYLMLTTNVYVKNMRRANWVRALFTKMKYLTKKFQQETNKLQQETDEATTSRPVIASISSELELLKDIIKDDRLRNNNEWFDEIATVFGFVFNTPKVFHMISKAYDGVYKNDDKMMKAKVEFLTKLLDKVSEKYMDKGNEKALAGNVDSKSTSYHFRRDGNAVVMMPLGKFGDCLSDKDDEQIEPFWKFVLSTVGPMETFLSDLLSFDMAFCCRDLRVKEKGRDATRREEIWLKIKNILFNLGHVNVSYPLASGSNRPGNPMVYHLNTFLPPVFDFAEETEENVTIYCDIDDDDVITIEDEIEEVEEEEAEREEEKEEEEEERKEERNAACEEIATKRGENDFAHFVAFMEIMLEQTNNYYDKMNKSYEKKVVKREEQEQEQEEEEEEEEEEGVQEAFSSLKMS